MLYFRHTDHVVWSHYENIIKISFLYSKPTGLTANFHCLSFCQWIFHLSLNHLITSIHSLLRMHREFPSEINYFPFVQLRSIYYINSRYSPTNSWKMIYFPGNPKASFNILFDATEKNPRKKKTRITTLLYFFFFFFFLMSLQIIY